MADNVAITAGSGTTIAADDIAGVLHQRVKISQGADGSATDVSSAAPLQVTLANTGANATPVVVDLGANNDVTVTSISAGDNNIGNVDLASAIPAGTNNIGDVDVLSIIPGTGATNLGKAVDTATGATDTGVLALGTRDDALSALTPIEGDNVQLRVDANGALWTHDDALDAALAGSELQVDVVGALPAGTNAIGKLAANSGVDIGDVDILSIAAGDNNIGNVDIASAIPAGTNNIGDVDVLTVPADPFGANADAAATAGSTGSIQAKLRLVTSQLDSIKTAVETLDNTVGGSEMQVDVVGALPAGTNAIGKLAANSGVDIGDVDVTSAVITGGAIADDATTPGNPIMIGGMAVETDGTDPGSVSAEDDVARLKTDRNRRVLVNTFHPNHWTLFENHTSAQTNNQLKTAPGANLSLYITDVVFSNGATAGTIFLVEDEGGTPVQISQTMYVPVNGGAVIHWNTPKRLTANKTLGFTSATVTTHSVEVHGFIAP